MKKLLTVLLILALLLPAVTVAEDSHQLTETEKQFSGTWYMNVTNGKGSIYLFFITFLDNMKVVRRVMVYKDWELATDRKVDGDWFGFTDDSIAFSLAGTDMMATIKDDGYLYMYFLDDFTLCGIYAKCEDMTERIRQ